MAIVPIVVGPTGVGKTEIVLRALKGANAGIVSADSRQIYRYMDIGTAKPTQEQRQQVPHYLVDCLDPDERFDAAQYGRLGRSIIVEIMAEGKMPVVVGGSGLYIRALLQGFFEGPGADSRIRQRLAQEEARGGPGTLYRRLARVDPRSADRIHPHDRVRAIRALEVHEITGTSLSQLQERGQYRGAQFRSFKLGLYRPRRGLYRRIDERVDQMVAQGLLEETRGLLARGYSPELAALSTVGYQEMIAHLQGKEDFPETVSRLKRDTRQYAKRQMTWFTKETDILWFHALREEDKFRRSLQLLQEGWLPEKKVLEERREQLRLIWAQRDEAV